MFSLRADCGRVIVYPGLKQWERPRHNIFGVCTRLAGGVCMSTSANSSASKHLTVTKIVWKIVYVTFDYLISHFFKILSLEFMANLFRDFRASVSLKVFHYRLRGKWCQYPASNATSGDIVTTLASVATVAVAHPTSRRRWLQIAGSTVCHFTSAARTWAVDSVCVGIVAGSSARRSPPDGRNQKTTCKFTIT